MESRAENATWNAKVEISEKLSRAKMKLWILELLDEAISDDIQCALKIQTEYGFKYWNRWSVRCKSTSDYNKYLPNLVNCLHR